VVLKRRPRRPIRTFVPFQAATGASSRLDANEAVAEAWAEVSAKLSRPRLVVVAATVGYDLPRLHAALVERLGDVPFMGGTSSGGVMTDRGFFGADGRGLGLFVIEDGAGDYGIGYAPLGTSPRQAARQAVLDALADAGCEGQLPTAVWMVTSPGGEEEVVLGIADAVGPDVPLVGGSAADDTIGGHWRQFARAGVLEGHVGVAVLFPSAAVSTSFHSGYDATAHQGVVTRAAGRTVFEIDGQPAARRYNQWLDGGLDAVIAAGGGELLAKTNLHPLGRFLREVKGVPYYVLSHPSHAHADGSLDLFTDLAAGEVLVCMTGTVENLVARAGNVVRSSLTNAGLTANDAAGALIIFCGGCLMTVRDQIAEVHVNVRRALEGVPFMTMFTFGEQGRIADVGNRHGNLMIATLTFSRS
jgi:hypothetical protein